MKQTTILLNKAANSRIETYVKVGTREQLFESNFFAFQGRTRADVEESNNQLIRPEGWPQKFLLQLLLIDVSR